MVAPPVWPRICTGSKGPASACSSAASVLQAARRGKERSPQGDRRLGLAAMAGPEISSFEMSRARAN